MSNEESNATAISKKESPSSSSSQNEDCNNDISTSCSTTKQHSHDRLDTNNTNQNHTRSIVIDSSRDTPPAIMSKSGANSDPNNSSCGKNDTPKNGTNANINTSKMVKSSSSAHHNDDEKKKVKVTSNAIGGNDNQPPPPLPPLSSSSTSSLAVKASSMPVPSSVAPVKVGTTTVIGGMTSSSSIHPNMTKMTSMKPLIIPIPQPQQLSSTTTTNVNTAKAITSMSQPEERTKQQSISFAKAVVKDSSNLQEQNQEVKTKDKNHNTLLTAAPILDNKNNMTLSKINRDEGGSDNAKNNHEGKDQGIDESKNTNQENQQQQPEPQEPSSKPKLPDLIPHPLINTDMKQIISDILILLQTYGPLTVYQIEYNLPPYPTLLINQNYNDNECDNYNDFGIVDQEEYRFKIIQDVLDVLTVVQVIHKTKVPLSFVNNDNDSLSLLALSGMNMSSTTITNTASSSSSGNHDHNHNNVRAVTGVAAGIDDVSAIRASSHDNGTTNNETQIMERHTASLLSTIPESNETRNDNDENCTSTAISNYVHVSSNNDLQKEQQQHKQNEKILYFFHNGKVRGDVIYPWEIMDMIQDANQEIDETLDRINLLKKELGVVDIDDTGTATNGDGNTVQQQPSTPKVRPPVKSGRKRKIDKLKEAIQVNTEPIQITPVVATTIPPSNRIKKSRDFFKDLLLKYPDIVHDPVYNAALRNFNVDLGYVARERERYSNLLSAVTGAGMDIGVSSSCAAVGSSSSGVKGGKRNSVSSSKSATTSTTISGKKRQLSSGQGASLSGKKKRKKSPVSKTTQSNEMKNDNVTTAVKDETKQLPNGDGNLLNVESNNGLQTKQISNPSAPGNGNVPIAASIDSSQNRNRMEPQVAIIQSVGSQSATKDSNTSDTTIGKPELKQNSALQTNEAKVNTEYNENKSVGKLSDEDKSEKKNVEEASS